MCLPFPIQIEFAVNGSNSPQPNWALCPPIKPLINFLSISSFTSNPSPNSVPLLDFFSGPIHAFSLFWLELEHIFFQNGCSSVFESPSQNRCRCSSMIERIIFTDRRFYHSNWFGSPLLFRFQTDCAFSCSLFSDLLKVSYYITYLFPFLHCSP